METFYSAMKSKPELRTITLQEVIHLKYRASNDVAMDKTTIFVTLLAINERHIRHKPQHRVRFLNAVTKRRLTKISNWIHTAKATKKTFADSTIVQLQGKAVD